MPPQKRTVTTADSGLQNFRPSELSHAARMKTIQAAMRAKLAATREKRGLLIVHTGNGKGKSTAAFGLVARTLAHKRPCAVIQFMKSSADALSRLLAAAAGPNLCWHHVGEGFTWDTQDRAADIAQCRAGWNLALDYMRAPASAPSNPPATTGGAAALTSPSALQPFSLSAFSSPSLLVLDELNVVLDLGYLPLDEVLAALREHRAKNPAQHIVITGRNAPAELIELADLVTEMREIKHPFNTGVQAQAGIEF